MKTALGILTGLALSVGSTLVPQFGTQAVAADDGCCKVRKALSSPDWDKETYKGFDDKTCKAFNADRDNDDVVEKKGYVWWDAKCE